jgi:hypothetical protein
MNCALVGTTKIASIHLKELLKVNFKKIYIVSRSKEKAENFLKKYKFKDKRILIVSKSILSKKISCVDICASTKHHHIFLNYLKKKKSFIIMEKPIISFTLFRKNFLYEIDKIFKNHKKIVTCNPMFFFAKSFIKNFKREIPKKIDNLEIYYHTNGSKTFNEIPIDLLTHIIDFIHEILRHKKVKINSIEKKLLKKNKQSWFYFGYLNKKIKLKISLKENKSLIQSKFYFKINTDKYLRETKVDKNNFLNFIHFKNKKIKIKNPMVQFLQLSLKNINNFKFIKKNQLLTRNTMRIKQSLIDN